MIRYNYTSMHIRYIAEYIKLRECSLLGSSKGKLFMLYLLKKTLI